MSKQGFQGWMSNLSETIAINAETKMVIERDENGLWSVSSESLSHWADRLRYEIWAPCVIL